MKKTHIPFYETYEDAKSENKSKLHYFKVVDKHEYRHWYDDSVYTNYLLVDENDPELMIVATYSKGRGYVALTESVQTFLDRKFKDDMERLCRNYYSNTAS